MIRQLFCAAPKIFRRPATQTRFFAVDSGRNNNGWKETCMKNEKTKLALETFEGQESLRETIARDVGLQQFLGRVYLTAGCGIATTLTVPIVAQTLAPEFVDSTALALLFGGAATSLAASVALERTKYTIDNAETRSINSMPRRLSFGLLIGGVSTMLTPFSQVISEISPSIWPTATVLSLATMGVATAWARSRPLGSLLTWQGPMYGGLAALLSTGVSALVAQAFFPSSGVAVLLHSIDVYGGIALFTALTAYETHKATEMYLNGNPDHMGCAVHVYLDFLNLLLRIADVLAKAVDRTK